MSGVLGCTATVGPFIQELNTLVLAAFLKSFLKNCLAADNLYKRAISSKALRVNKVNRTEFLS